MDRPPGGPFRPQTSHCPPRVGYIMGVIGDALVMGGAAPILFWCAAACRPRAWSARRSGALVWARPSAATPVEAGGWGRWGARCVGPAAPPPPPPPRRSHFWGRGGVPSAPGGGGSALLRPSSRGGSGGGGEGGPLRRPPPPRPVGCQPAILCLRRAPAGYTRSVGVAGRSWAAVGVGRGPFGRQWVSAAGGGGGRAGGISSPWFAPLPSPGRPLKGALRLRRPGRRRSAVGP